MIPASVILVKETFKSPIIGRMDKFALLERPSKAIYTEISKYPNFVSLVRFSLLI
jgi:hypothetical protein